MKKLLSMTLEEIYLDYVNNFFSIATMALHYGVEQEEMYKLYWISRDLYCKVCESKEL